MHSIIVWELCGTILSSDAVVLAVAAVAVIAVLHARERMERDRERERERGALVALDLRITKGNGE